MLTAAAASYGATYLPISPALYLTSCQAHSQGLYFIITGTWPRVNSYQEEEEKYRNDRKKAEKE